MADVVLSGVASEYVLGGLANYLRECGHRVFEFDFANFKGDALEILKSLDGGQCTYITSAHTNLTKVAAAMLAPMFVNHYPNYLSPLEILGILRPKQSIYIPHDLLSPFGGDNLNECRHLDLFDHIFSPFPDPALQAVVGAQTRVHTAGWIKHTRISPPVVDRNDIKSAAATRTDAPTAALFISMIEHLRWRYGEHGVVDYFKPLLGSNVLVKLPDWQGVDAIESIFANDTQCRVFPSTENSVDLICQADVVICNGASSIHAEANLLGRPTICLLDDEGVTAAEQQRKLKHLPCVHFHDYRKRSPLPVDLIPHLLKNSMPKIAPIFDFERVEAIIAGPA